MLEQLASVTASVAVIFAFTYALYGIFTRPEDRERHTEATIEFLIRASSLGIWNVAGLYTTRYALLLDRLFLLGGDATLRSMYRVSLYSAITFSLGLTIAVYGGYIVLVTISSLFIILIAYIVALWERRKLYYAVSIIVLATYALLDSAFVFQFMSSMSAGVYIVSGIIIMPFLAPTILYTGHLLYPLFVRIRVSILVSIVSAVGMFLVFWVSHVIFLEWSYNQLEMPWIASHIKFEMLKQQVIAPMMILIVSGVNFAADYLSIVVTFELLARLSKKWSTKYLLRYFYYDVGIAILISGVAIVLAVGVVYVFFMVSNQESIGELTWCKGFGVDLREQLACLNELKKGPSHLFALSGSFNFEILWLFRGAIIIIFSTVGPTLVLAILVIMGIVARSFEWTLETLHQGIVGEMSESAKKVQRLICFAVTVALFFLLLVMSALFVGGDSSGG